LYHPLLVGDFVGLTVGAAVGLDETGEAVGLGVGAAVGTLVVG
jgi:hypothetical protein